MKVKFYGVRGSLATPGPTTIKYGGNTTSLLFEFNSEPPLIIDSGTGIKTLGKELASTKGPINLRMFITHSHWDHIQGFPFFLPAYLSRTQITIMGCPPSWKKLNSILSDQMEYEFFPVNFEDLSANISFIEVCRALIIFGSANASMIRTNHPATTYGLRIQEGGKSIVFLTDNELNAEVNKHTDFETFVRFCKNTDILIHDGQYTKEELKKKKGWGHSCMEDVIKLGIASEAKKIVITHHDTERSDEELDKLQDLFREKYKKETSSEIIFAFEGLSLST